MLEPSPGRRRGPAWARRDLLRLGLGLPLLTSGLAACATGPAVDTPTVSSGPTGLATGASTATASPGPTAAVPAAATAEQRLSVYAAAVLAGPHRRDLDHGTRTLLGFLHTAHARHATALAGSDPTTRPTTASPAPTAAPPHLGGLSLRAALDRLARAEAAQAAAQHRAALSATGLSALLSGSLAVAATSFAAALRADHPPGVAALHAPRPAALLTDVAATQAVVAQLHAIVYGYQLAIGRLKVGSGSRSRAYAGLAAQRALLDELIAVLNGRRASVPAAEPAYVPSPDPGSAGQAVALIRSMEVRLTPYAGVLLAAAGSRADRSRALTVLSRTARTAQAWGAPLRAWPGWSD